MCDQRLLLPAYSLAPLPRGAASQIAHGMAGRRQARAQRSVTLSRLTRGRSRYRKVNLSEYGHGLNQQEAEIAAANRSWPLITKDKKRLFHLRQAARSRAYRLPLAST